jgi:hypothetical protein
MDFRSRLQTRNKESSSQHKASCLVFIFINCCVIKRTVSLRLPTFLYIRAIVLSHWLGYTVFVASQKKRMFLFRKQSENILQ